jgi:hypothetical protein
MFPVQRIWGQLSCKATDGAMSHFDNKGHHGGQPATNQESGEAGRSESCGNNFARKGLNFSEETFDVLAMDLARFTSFYRRDSDEVLGAVRLSAVETIAMEQMPGGRFQIVARTAAGSDGFVSCVMGTLTEGQQMLELMRKYLGGDGEANPAETFIKERDKARLDAETEEALRVVAEQAELRDTWVPPAA